ncbi:MAG TPA: O-antigen ligase family protein [Candidatus Magasanikbacteria bacterium]|nr:O-antigen ligase family protein [Candidatus Magasanikbacteria bacterium]
MKFSWPLFGVILFWELLSYLSYSTPLAQSILFVIICLTVLLTAGWDFKKGLLVGLLELFIGGFGYLFSWQSYGPKISLRIGLFLILMTVGLIKIIKQKKVWVINSLFFKSLIWLGSILILGVILAFLNHQTPLSIFLDGNAFIFLLYFWLFSQFFRSLQDLKELFVVFKTVVFWLSCKIIGSFILFVSGSTLFGGYFYKWIRDTRLGEITEINQGVYRIFFQSAIFLVFYLLIYYSQLIVIEKNKINWVGSVIVWAAILITLSRSFWLGMALGLCLLFVLSFIFLRIKFKRLLKIFGQILVQMIMAVFVLILIITLAHPSHNPKLLLNVFGKRAAISGDAAISTRTAELAPLITTIKQHPFWGYGFGKTITFISDDPRVRAINPTGVYTTYALEWGWLDLVLKIGLIGVLIFLNLIWQMAKKSWFLVKKMILKNKSYESESGLVLGLFITLISLSIIHFFTPYLNHPLGLGWLAITLAALDVFYLVNFKPINKF